MFEFLRLHSLCVSVLNYRILIKAVLTVAVIVGFAPLFARAEDYFADQVWTKVGARVCLNCHHADGDASDSQFLLKDPADETAAVRKRMMSANAAEFRDMALAREEGNSRLLAKVTGGLDHGGERVVEPNSTEFKILRNYVRRLKPDGTISADPADQTDQTDQPAYTAGPYFANVTMLDGRRLLRRVTLSLAGRLPAVEEQAALQRDGLSALDSILDNVMREDAFYDRLAEGFNDIFLTVGYDGVPERALGYRNFGKTRHWTQSFDLDHVPDSERAKARYQLTDDYREAMLREPMELIKHIVRNNRPFTELVTADYIMVSPYTARGYGVFDELKSRFKDSDDHLEFIPARIKALRKNNGDEDQVSPTGWFPHSGMLTTFHWLRRYPTTETNRNRLRSRMYYQHFLGVDIMALAPRVTDAAAVDAKYEVPTIEAADCVVCHKTVDPVAGLFQDFYDTGMDNGPFSPRKDGWFTDMFGPGLEGEALPVDETWRSLQWLGERTAKDPRFAVAMVEHVYYILTGRKVLVRPQDIDHPLFEARQRAFTEQRELIARITRGFVAKNFDLKYAFKAWVASPFYRADGLATELSSPHRGAELADVGLVRLLTPEQLNRKIAAIFGQPWDRFDQQLQLLYGGIDSKEVTERLADPSGAMGAIQRIMSNAIACKHVATDFALPVDQRRLFPKIDRNMVPGESVEADGRIRETIVELHRLILGRYDTVDNEEVNRTFELFASIVKDASEREGIEPVESYFCNSIRDGKRDKDPKYALRAWRGVVTYLLRQEEFLYE